MSTRPARALTLCLLLLLLAALTRAQEGAVSDNDVIRVAERMYCPVCENIPLDDCETIACVEWKDEIRAQLAAGRGDEEIINSFVARFGDNVVGLPQDPVLRALTVIMPLLATALAIGAGLFTFRRFAAQPRLGIPPPPAPAMSTVGATRRVARKRTRIIAGGWKRTCGGGAEMADDEQLEFLPRDDAASRRGLSLGSLALLAALLALALALGLQLSRRSAARPTSGAAPDFSLSLFDGRDFRLSDLRGEVVLINFWASWCPPCRDEAPDLQALYEEYREAGFRVIGVNMLESAPRKALEFIEEFGLSYPNGEDLGERVTNLYRVEAPPESFLIDRRGAVRQFFIGAIPYDDLSRRIEALLAEAP